jgi:CHAT domain-containing protein
MLELMRVYPHPYYWAPFALIGGLEAGTANDMEVS